MVDPKDWAYDVVVIGAGPAGCALASRMSEDPALEVLMVELGKDWRTKDAPPEMYAHRWTAYMGLESLAPFHSMDIMARKTEQAEPSMYFGGRGTGGSSNINGQMCVRPPLDTYDSWGDLGATRWSGSMALELWKRIESDRDFGDQPMHGDDGPLSIERPRMEDFNPLDKAFWEAALKAGYQPLEDLNGSDADGMAPLPYGRRDGKRVTANHAYIEPARERSNLTVLGNARVDRVVLNEDGSRALGVLASVDGESVLISAEHVVCSAGTIGTGGLLLRSGIGPAADLRAVGIDVVHDLPVGRNLQDHFMFAIAVDWTLPDDMMDLSTNFSNCAMRYSSGLGGAPAGDMFMLPLGPFTVFDLHFPPSITFWTQETFSRGWLKLRSGDPEEWPEMNIGMWQDERDLIRVRDGVRRAIALLDSPEFALLGGSKRTVGAAAVPLIDDLEDDAALDELIRAHGEPHAHISCSAPMGEPGSEMAVVDPDAKVIGVDNLWVADLSICPKVVRSGPYPTAMLIGEFVSDVMREKLGSLAAVGSARNG